MSIAATLEQPLGEPEMRTPGSHPSVDELVIHEQLGMCRDWATRKRLVCDLAEHRVRRLDGVLGVWLSVFEREAELVIEGAVSVSDASVIETVSEALFGRIVPLVEKYLSVGIDAKHITFDLT